LFILQNLKNWVDFLKEMCDNELRQFMPKKLLFGGSQHEEVPGSAAGSRHGHGPGRLRH
jgi:hypothetical protein